MSSFLVPVLGATGIRTFGSLIGFILAVIIGFVCSKIAGSKGRRTVLWGILGFFFTLLALIIIAVLPSKRTVSS